MQFVVGLFFLWIAAISEENVEKLLASVKILAVKVHGVFTFIVLKSTCCTAEG